jgi:hypothetical protein
LVDIFQLRTVSSWGVSRRETRRYRT